MPSKEPPSRLQQAPQAGAKASCLPQSPGEQASGALEDLDSYIDFSLESLNQMILELDPTFQLLPPGPGGPWAEPTQSTTSRRKKEEPEALDIKYIEVTSTRSSQSFLCSSISSHQSSSRSLESPASSSSSLHSLGPVSLYTRASDLQVPSNPTPSMGQPRATHSSPLAKEHASSCPPSITNSMVDIPIVLINSCPEPGSPPSQRTPGHQDFVCPGATSSSNPCPATRSHSQTLPDAPLTTSPEGPARDMQPTMKFVMDTSKYWFKPSITREQAIELLRKEEPGAFIVRDSSSYRGSFGLALKVQEAPAPDQNRSELGGGDGASDPSADGRASCLKKSAGCHALYLSSVSVETLSGALAVQKAISTTLERDVLPTPTVVHFKVTEQGITLTDIQRKVFFRRHYPFATLRFCGMDPKQRKIFGFVAKSQTESQENVCHLFAEYDTVQPASQVISLVGALLQDPERM
ncbi:Tensin-4, partial [Eschrichtius robustus]|nr:Tensin-4 [Eschrichtius robustus]